MGVSTALITSALITAAAQGGQAWVQHNQQKHAQEDQAKAQQAAEEKQAQADREAEQKRLEGLSTAAASTDYGNIWGANANTYKDAAQKLSAGTGSFDNNDEENPFYTKGLL